MRLLRARNKDGEQCIRCELPDGTTETLPGWMTDAETCTQMSADEPVIDVLALAHLLPATGSPHSALENPVYAGAYVFERTETPTTIVDGGPRVH